MLLCFFNFGRDSFHSLLSVVVTFSLTRCLPGGSGAAVILGFLFHVIYLTLGYIHVAGEKYDVTWTTAQCVLCLRHVGLLFDLWDGAKKDQQRKNAEGAGGDAGAASAGSSAFPAPLALPPTFLQLLAHTYFFGGFLVGPQFPMARYLHFIEDFSPDKSRELGAPDAAAKVLASGDAGGKAGPTSSSSSTAGSALQRLFMGLLYVAAFQIGVLVVPQSYLLSDEFLGQASFAYKMTYILLWGKIVLYKYVGCWLIAEGSCILSGENGSVSSLLHF